MNVNENFEKLAKMAQQEYSLKKLSFNINSYIYDTIVAKCSANIVGFKLKVNHHEKQKQKYRKK